MSEHRAYYALDDALTDKIRTANLKVMREPNAAKIAAKNAERAAALVTAKTPGTRRDRAV